MPEFKFTSANFEEEVIKSEVPVLVDFWAEWCGPCRMMEPILENLARDFEGKPVKIGKCNVEESSDLAQKYEILSVPAFKIFKGGKVVEEFVGAQTKDGLKTKLEKIL